MVIHFSLCSGQHKSGGKAYQDTHVLRVAETGESGCNFASVTVLFSILPTCQNQKLSLLQPDVRDHWGQGLKSALGYCRPSWQLVNMKVFLGATRAMVHFDRIFHCQPSSYWDTTVFSYPSRSDHLRCWISGSLASEAGGLLKDGTHLAGSPWYKPWWFKPCL